MDDDRFWRPIECPGRWLEMTDNNSCPDDDQFKAHYEELLSPPGVDILQSYNTGVYFQCSMLTLHYTRVLPKVMPPIFFTPPQGIQENFL